MLKLLVLVTSIATITPTATSSLYYATAETTNNYAISREVLRKDILANRIYGGKVNYSEYDGHTFYSEEALNEHLLKNNKVTSVVTSSNPNKIIKNYEYMTLDDKKIYDADLNNFPQLYRDAFGNVAYTQEKALQTYTNEGLVKPQYSYDGFYWFDTPEEAKINEKYKMQINKSLYYIYNNEYYNAFNTQDINALISLMDEGYYANLNQSLLGKTLLNPIVQVGDSKLIYVLLKKDFRKDFNGDYYKTITKTETKYRLAISPTGSNRLTVEYYDYKTGRRLNNKDYYAGDSTTIELKGNNFSGGNALIRFFKNNAWNRRAEGSLSISGRYYRTREFRGVYKNQDAIILINLVPKWSYAFGKSDPQVLMIMGLLMNQWGKLSYMLIKQNVMISF
ncbi:hypothetical protein [Spiroplasma endosymbiont of Stenodema calcarata]|uniref:hypothetical protein n=1 Tax=Spiroplasma endosymbiont of Stenodema calcarata TaxID=3139328 RepID=UPI003CCA9B5C